MILESEWPRMGLVELAWSFHNGLDDIDIDVLRAIEVMPGANAAGMRKILAKHSQTRVETAISRLSGRLCVSEHSANNCSTTKNSLLELRLVDTEDLGKITYVDAAGKISLICNMCEACQKGHMMRCSPWCLGHHITDFGRMVCHPIPPKEHLLPPFIRETAEIDDTTLEALGWVHLEPGISISRLNKNLGNHAIILPRSAWNERKEINLEQVIDGRHRIRMLCEPMHCWYPIAQKGPLKSFNGPPPFRRPPLVVDVYGLLGRGYHRSRLALTIAGESVLGSLLSKMPEMIDERLSFSVSGPTPSNWEWR